MNEKIETIKAAGLVEFWNYQNFDRNFLNFKETQGPKVLTFDQLVGSFLVLIFGCSIGFFIFIIEVVIKQVRFLEIVVISVIKLILPSN